MDLQPEPPETIRAQSPKKSGIKSLSAPINKQYGPVLLSVAIHLIFLSTLYVFSQEPEPLLLSSENTYTVDIQSTANQGAATTSDAPPVQSQPKTQTVTEPASPKRRLSFSQYVGSTSAVAPENAAKLIGGGQTGAGQNMGVVGGHRVQRLPRVIREVKATYPAAAKAQGMEARVVLAVVVGADGSVKKAKAITAKGNSFDEAFNQAAEQALMQFLFSPALLENKPVTVEIRYTYEFTLR